MADTLLSGVYLPLLQRAYRADNRDSGPRNRADSQLCPRARQIFTVIPSGPDAAVQARNTVSGSTRVARHAGTSTATAVVATSTKTARPMASGGAPVTSGRNPRMARAARRWP